MTRLVFFSATIILFFSGTSFTKISGNSFKSKSYNLIDTNCSINTLGDCALTVNSGFDILICEGSSVQLLGEVGPSYTSLLWTSSSGLGSFDDPEIINPVFTPDPQDAGNTITLTLTARDDNLDCDGSDGLDLSIFSLPVVNAGEDLVVCEGSTFQLNGLVDQEDYVVEWEGGTGLFSNIFSAETTYQPTILDPNPLVLTLTARDPVGTCERISSDIIITFTPDPEVDAGSDDFTCGTNAFDLSVLETIPSSNNGETYSWTSNGSGSFSDPNVMVPVFIPAEGDQNTTIVLTVEVSGGEGCGNVTDEVMLTVHGDVSVDAGSDELITIEDIFNLSSSISVPSAENYISLNWEHDGNGQLSDPGVLFPTYIPSLLDEGRQITFRLNAIGHCESISDEMILNIESIVTGLLPVNDKELSAFYDIYSKNLKVSFSDNQQWAEWAVYDMSGRQRADGKININTQEMEIPLSHLNEGVYVLHMGQLSEKFIVHK